MTNILLIGLGGFLGVIFRYLLAKKLNELAAANFPIGTLAVNVIGSFFIGFIIYSVSAGRNISPEFRDFLTIGLIGGFTTMSSFAYESFRLLELNQLTIFVINCTLNVILSLAAVYLGKEFAMIITK